MSLPVGKTVVYWKYVDLMPVRIEGKILCILDTDTYLIDIFNGSTDIVKL